MEGSVPTADRAPFWGDSLSSPNEIGTRENDSFLGNARAVLSVGSGAL